MKSDRSILYQRGIYSAESFEAQRQYGLTMMVTTDPGLTKYLTSVLQQMSGRSLFYDIFASQCYSQQI
jgi:mitotic spindle assembly checkpoint protein MAD2